MPDRVKINEQITVGAQPTEEELQQLAREGAKSIVNLRAAGEPEQPLSPEQEGTKVRELGMDYLHFPVSMRDLRPEQVDQFRQEFVRLPGPVFVHCHRGMRAGVLAMMHSGVESARTGQQTLESAGQLGFPCDAPELRQFIKDYVDRHRQ